MIPQEFEYSAPSSLQEALALLATGDAKVLAGGMSLIPLMKLRLAAPGHVIDLGRVAGLSYIREDAGQLRIGPMTTHYEIESSPLLRARCPLLAEAAAQIGDVQVRNMGTIGGSVAHADPAADYPASLLALEARVRLVRASGERTLTLPDFLVDTMTTALEPDELVGEVIVPLDSAGTAGYSYQKMSHPASGFAIVGAAALVGRSNGRVTFARVGITGLAAKAFRATAVENLMEATGDIDRASAAVAQGVEANTDLAASADYRRHVAQVYTARALRQATARIF